MQHEDCPEVWKEYRTFSGRVKLRSPYHRVAGCPGTTDYFVNCKFELFSKLSHVGEPVVSNSHVKDLFVQLNPKRPKL